MLKVNFLHFCESAIVEQGTGNLSIINVFENINAQSFPALHPSMTIVAGFENNNPGIYDVEIIFLDETAEIVKIQSKVNIGINLKGNFITKIAMYQIPREATQKIKLNYEGKTIHEAYLTINNK
jgi:hypothetical protein